MIYDAIDNFRLYPLGARWEQAFAFIRTLRAATPDGEYSLDGDRLFCKVLTYDTRSPEAGNIESHRTYADIQVCLRGAEGIDLFDREVLMVRDPYEARTDLVFYQAGPVPRARVDVLPGYFVYLLPRDAHRPQMVVGEELQTIKKAVIKVRLR